MKNSLEVDCTSYISQSAINNFVEGMNEFSATGRKSRKQLLIVSELLRHNGVRSFIPWPEVDSALNFVHNQDINQVRSKLAQRLREACLEASITIDPITCKPFNPSGLIYTVTRGLGLQLGYIGCYQGKKFNYAINQALEERRSELVKVAERGLGASQADELSALDHFLDSRILMEKQLGDYRIVREVGSGSTGVVYEAEMPDRQGGTTQVAVKVLHQHLCRDGAFTKRIMGTARKFAGLDHPNIAKILHADGKERSSFYYVTEFVEGGTLDARELREKIDAPGKLKILGKIIDALAFLHGHEVVHGDLKPSNVLVTANGTPKLIDFDTSYYAGMTSMSSIFLGPTLQYSSEEIILQPMERLPDNDVYAFGTLALELLNGRKDCSKHEQIQLITKQDSLRAIYPVLAKCIQPRNTSTGMLSRYRTGAELRRAWEKALGDTTDRAYPVPLVIGYHKQGLALKNQTIRGVSYQGRLLPQSDFKNCTLVDCDFNNSVLSDATFTESKLINCNFEGAFLIMSRFHDVILENTHFCYTNLERSVWDNIDLAGVRFVGANLWGAFLGRAKNLNLADIRYSNIYRTELTLEQSEYVDSLDNIARGYKYSDVRAAFEKFFPEMPDSLWWLRMLTESDSTILMY